MALENLSERGPNCPQPELSRIVHVENLGPQEFTQDIHAQAAERAALAGRLGVDRLNDLTAGVTLHLRADGEVVLNGQLNARVTQTCGITLEPVESEISSSFSIHYSEDPGSSQALDEEQFSGLDDNSEAPEMIVDGKIDIGDVIAEQLSLEIAPFPRVKGAQFDGYSTGDGSETRPVSAKPNPFEVLRKLGGGVKSSE